MTRGIFWINFALLVFVMIAVSLGVTWFVFYKKVTEITAQNEFIVSDNQQKDSLVSSLKSESDRLKAMIGATPETSTEDIIKEKDDLMKKYAQNFSPSNQSYSKVAANLYNQIQSQFFTLDNINKDILDLVAFNKSRDDLNSGRTKKVEDITTEVSADIDTQTALLQTMAASLESYQKQIADIANKSTGKNTTELAKLSGQIKELEDKIKERNKTTVDIREGMDKMEGATSSSNSNHEDGLISYVDVASGKAAINIGRADEISTKVTFTVYDGRVTDFDSALPKGGIEVVMVTGEHSSECRILTDNPSDPIVPGDKIYSPVWDPGYREHFAIAGFIDFDHDGSDDLAKLIGLIERNGGVIDGYQNGDVQKGRLMEKTDCLVLGPQPDESSTESFRNVYKDFKSNADAYNTKTVTVRELFKRMGYDPERSNVVRYEDNTNPNTFRPQPYEGVNRSNGASLSPLFKDEEDREPVQAVPFNF